MADKALGMIETRGLIASIEAADAMLKAAKVQLIGKEKITAGLVSILIVGETAAVKSAVDAGAAAAQRVGQVVSTHIIPRPDAQVDEMVSVEREEIKEKKVKTEPTRGRKPKKEKQFQLEKEKPVAEDIKINKPGSTSTIDRLKEEALGDIKNAGRNVNPKSGKSSNVSMAELEVMNVHQLRRFARDFENFPIKGREISRANRGELLDFFKTLLK